MGNKGRAIVGSLHLPSLPTADHPKAGMGPSHCYLSKSGPVLGLVPGLLPEFLLAVRRITHLGVQVVQRRLRISLVSSI